MTDLEGARVLVTGACGGFGRRMTQQFLQAGACVAVSDLNGERIDELVSSLLTAMPAAQITAQVAVDLSKPEGAATLFDALHGQRVDVLVNNAGIALFGRHDEVPVAHWETLLALNLLAPMRLCAQFAPAMVERRSGHIVNISSVAGWMGASGMASYSAAKFGLRGFSESLSEELHAHNVKVTTVYPFFSRTPILDSARYGSMPRIEPPDAMVTNPDGVVRKIVAGVRRDRRHVFPDGYARMLHWTKRLTPWLIPPMNRALYRLASRRQQS